MNFKFNKSFWASQSWFNFFKCWCSKFLIKGNIKDSLYKTPISSVEIYNSDGNLLAISDQYGNFKFRSKKGN